MTSWQLIWSCVTVGLLVVFAVAGIRFALGVQKKAIAAWGEAAEELGLTFKPPGPRKDMPAWLGFLSSWVMQGRVAGSWCSCAVGVQE